MLVVNPANLRRVAGSFARKDDKLRGRVYRALSRLYKKYPEVHSLVPFYAQDGRLAYEVIVRGQGGWVVYDKEWTE